MIAILTSGLISILSVSLLLLVNFQFHAGLFNLNSLQIWL
ncbi:hypothetical protein OMCYN_00510 [cyanobiont of Ornithocercus magnificus]|nr:hypothetical protein OMCYN_00510 [cyanobiont of Ornithocercus magnificus]